MISIRVLQLDIGQRDELKNQNYESKNLTIFRIQGKSQAPSLNRRTVYTFPIHDIITLVILSLHTAFSFPLGESSCNQTRSLGVYHKVV